MKTPLLVVSLFTSAAACFAEEIVIPKSTDQGGSSPKAEAAAVKPARKYKATTKFLVSPMPSGEEGGTPRWLETQIKIIQSAEVRRRVVQREKLAQRWQVQEREAAAKLERMTEVEQERGTRMLTVTVFSTDAAETAALANATRLAYEEYRTAQETERLAGLSKKIADQIKAQEAKVERSRAEMQALAEKYRIKDLAPISGAPAQKPPSDDSTKPETRNGNTPSQPAGKVAADERQGQTEYAAARHSYEASLMLLNTIKELAARQMVDERVLGKPVELLEEARPPVR